MQETTTNRLDGPTSMSALVGGIISDAQLLIRQEVALARREVQEEVTKAKVAALSFAAGAAVAFFGVMLLCFMFVYLFHWLTNGLPPGFPLWACFGIVGAVLVAVGAGLLLAARSKLSEIHVVPPRTAQTLKENVQWIKTQT